MLERSIAGMIEEMLYNMEYLYDKSPKTTKPYSIALNEFNKYIFANDGKISDMINLTAIDILTKWLKIVEVDGNDGKGLSASSLNQRIVAISQFYQYLIGLNLPIREVTRGLKKFKNVKSNDSKKALTIDETSAFLDEFQNVNTKLTDYEISRNEMMVNLFLGCGLRLEELSLLEYKHINVKEGKIYITEDISKFGKEATVDMPEPVIKLYTEYLKIRMNNKNKSQFLFISRRNQKMHVNSIRHAIRSTSKSAIGREVNPHSLRHTYATQMIEAGEDINYVSEQMRHANIAITSEIYKHQVRNAPNKCNNPIFKNR